MSHPEQLAFIELVVNSLSGSNRSKKVLEIGSYDVNGTIRDVIGLCEEYVGVDLVEGPGVSVVEYGHKVDFNDSYFDLSLSSECFEHDPHWQLTFLNMIRLTRPSGVVVFTCASNGRPEHGTIRSNPFLSPGTQSVSLDYYLNLNALDFEAAFNLQNYFSHYRFYENPITWDLYFVGVRLSSKGNDEEIFEIPSINEVRAATSLTPVSHKVARIPHYCLFRLLPEVFYNQIAFRYWRLLEAANRSFMSGKFER